MCCKAVGAGRGEENLADFVWMGCFLLASEVLLYAPSGGRGRCRMIFHALYEVHFDSFAAGAVWLQEWAPFLVKEGRPLSANISKLQNLKTFPLSAFSLSETK